MDMKKQIGTDEYTPCGLRHLFKKVLRGSGMMKKITLSPLLSNNFIRTIF